ncbi:MAG: hypothetical protein HQL94_06495 [Magnetococcales bacterium]|nr:hypothetical protein [Magnetococcales bacterium]
MWDSFTRRLPARLPIQADGGLPGVFGQWFEKDLPWIQTEWKDRLSILEFLRESWIGLFLTAPVIWSVSIPLVLLDLMASLYQTICFPVYGIPIVDRSKFVIMDRHKLAYLDWLEKLNCAYCAYGNGVLAYVREIASRTEEYWCPIKHAKTPMDPHSRYIDFAKYGDQKGYVRKKSEINLVERSRQ